MAGTILGIDPGSRATGLAILKNGSLVHAEALNLDNLTEAQITDHLFMLKHEHEIDEVCMEKQPGHHGALWAEKTLRRCCAFANLPKPRTILPQVWRSKLGLKTRGGRRVLKKASVDYVFQRFGFVSASDDIAEAICLACVGILHIP